MTIAVHEANLIATIAAAFGLATALQPLRRWKLRRSADPLEDLPTKTALPTIPRCWIAARSRVRGCWSSPHRTRSMSARWPRPRAANPTIEIVVRTHSDEEAALLRQEKVGAVFMGEQELAAGMTRYVLARMAA